MLNVLGKVSFSRRWRADGFIKEICLAMLNF
jgi:hypothetical protein